ncbi:DUF488 family protein [Stenotrophomonas maltophilia]|uniref:DUF488 domain-containing protein n=1 Tax=Stenotrophomonas maltophilia TaxID=40324 RepID=A0A4S2CZH2_STEMA|nr:DUF488 domain-containing protein [Stenotrophomonas maltophilia]TGY34086.1 DUF488 domain-containing protein [Stenotrophomonas maltophilia]
MKLPFFTIGHSDRSLDTFAGLLKQADVTHVADIRKMPRSRANPQFNEDSLVNWLATLGIGYEHIAALGGLRAKTVQVPADVNGFWINRSFHNYADYALSSHFNDGITHLIEQGRKQRCVMMCAEAVWWRCHRRIVADHLIARGEAVFHIMSENRIEPAQLTPGAVIESDLRVIYPEENQGL